jgi:hypothetical protein
VGAAVVAVAAAAATVGAWDGTAPLGAVVLGVAAVGTTIMLLLGAAVLGLVFLGVALGAELGAELGLELGWELGAAVLGAELGGRCGALVVAMANVGAAVASDRVLQPLPYRHHLPMPFKCRRCRRCCKSKLLVLVVVVVVLLAASNVLLEWLVETNSSNAAASRSTMMDAAAAVLARVRLAMGRSVYVFVCMRVCVQMRFGMNVDEWYATFTMAWCDRTFHINWGWQFQNVWSHSDGVAYFFFAKVICSCPRFFVLK